MRRREALDPDLIPADPNLSKIGNSQEIFHQRF
jgi:hypothetical protein